MQAMRGAWPLNTWPENFISARLNSDVSLECRTDREDIIWKKGGLGIAERSPRILSFTRVDQPDAGNYTCWSGDQIVSSVYLFISEQDGPSGISCNAASYLDTRLKCTWTHSLMRAPHKIRAKAERGHSDVTPWVDVHMANDGTVAFQLELSDSCLYGEEDEPITVRLEAINDQTYTSENRTLALRDIIKPSCPENVNVLKLPEGAVQVNWNYPSSWVTPHSYFPLLFHVEQHFHNKSRIIIPVEGGNGITLTKKVKAVRLKCRDLFYNSEWSDWTKTNSLSDRTTSRQSYPVMGR
ncbi:interleukin-12 subunit beta-like [Ambystoma mexicanum]|uniref:interleukin-12 subunit beta-like n=1 Tax=Ambystoma mexicanum TaxID=8296 RepID=UPI0037E760AA